MNLDKNQNRKFRVMPYAPGYGYVVWIEENGKEKTCMFFSGREIVRLSDAIKNHAQREEYRAVEDWLCARKTEGEK